MKKQEFVYCNKIYFVGEDKSVYGENGNLIDTKKEVPKDTLKIEADSLRSLADKVWEVAFNK